MSWFERLFHPVPVTITGRTWLAVCSVVVFLSIAVGGLAYVIFVQNEDIQKGVRATCGNGAALVEVLQDPSIHAPQTVIDRLVASGRDCPD